MMSVIALATAFFVAVRGVIFGRVGLSQIQNSGEPGRAFTIAAVVVGYAMIALR